jgi:pimeloyl-ACP methyl ester carboxylesterase
MRPAIDPLRPSVTRGSHDGRQAPTGLRWDPMTAWLLRALLAVMAMLAVIAAVWLAHRGWPLALAAVVGLGLPVALHIGLLGVYFALSRRFGDPMHAPGAKHVRVSLIRVWLRESLDSLVAFCWRMPFQGDRPLPSAAAPGATGRLPVLLLHGYGCNRAVWLSMAKTLAAGGHVIGSVNLEPPLGSIDEYADTIEEAARELCHRSGRAQVALVCHSMGGLAARAYLRRYGEGHVCRVITLGTPHRGTTLATFGQGLNVRQMRPDSPWLRTLAADEPDARAALFTCVLTHHDNIVFPQAIQTLPGAKTIALSGVGHLSLLSDPRVSDLVMYGLREAHATADRSPTAATGLA